MTLVDVARRRGGRALELICGQRVVASVAAVSAIYAIAVVVRFALYMATPFWSGDEYLYKSIALEIFETGRHGTVEGGRVGVPLNLPNLLYPYVIAPTFLFGDAFYTGMRLVNSITMNLAAFPVYFLARRFVRPLAAVGLAVAAMVTPFINIGAFAATEVLFYPVFLAFAWVSVTAVQHSWSVSRQLIVGALAAALLNIRSNGIVLLPAYLFALFCYLICIRRVRDAIVKPVWLVSVIAFAGCHWAMQSLLHGPGALHFGVYGTLLGTPGVGPVEVLQRDPKGAIDLVLGHLLTLAIPYAFPIGMLATSTVLIRTKLTRRSDLQALVLVTATLAVALIATALAFTVKIAPSDMGGLGRWHSRYYFYLYPLLLVVGVALWTEFETMSKPERIAVAAITAVIIFLGAATLAFTDVPSSVWFGSIADNMDVQWITFARPLYWFFAVITLIAAAAWCTSKRLASARILLCGLATWCVVANVGAMETSRLGKVSRSGSCGSTAARLASMAHARYAIFGASRADVVGIGFWTWRLPQATRVIARDSTTGPPDIDLSGLDMILTKGLGQFDVGRQVLEAGDCRAYVLN